MPVAQNQGLGLDLNKHFVKTVEGWLSKIRLGSTQTLLAELEISKTQRCKTALTLKRVRAVDSVERTNTFAADLCTEARH